MMLPCCVCNREWPKEKCVVLTLTEDERAMLIKNEGSAPETLAYCNPCWRVLSDRMMGAQLIRSTLQVHLRQNGVGNAEQQSQAYFDRLLQLTSKPKS